MVVFFSSCLKDFVPVEWKAQKEKKKKKPSSLAWWPMPHCSLSNLKAKRGQSPGVLSQPGSFLLLRHCLQGMKLPVTFLLIHVGQMLLWSHEHYLKLLFQWTTMSSLSWDFYCCNKDHDQKQAGKEPHLTVHHWGKAGQDCRARIWGRSYGGATYWFAQLASSYTPGLPAQEWHHSQWAWPPHINH